MTRILSLLLAVLILVNYGCEQHHPETKTSVEGAVTREKDYSTLYATIDSLANTVKGRIGVSFINLNTGDSFAYNGNDSFKMFSTYKLPLVLYVLHLAEEGRLSLQQPVTIKRQSFSDYGGGEFIRAHKPGDITLPVDSLIWYAMAYSDNITTDHLFQLVGGPAAVDDFMKQKGVTGMFIKNTVLEMGKGNLYHQNRCTPAAMAVLLKLFYKDEIVNNGHKRYLLEYMRLAPSGKNRIKALLPAEAAVAHKTGTGNTINGITEAVNDVGYITLSNGQVLAIAVYINDIAADMEGGEAYIARMAKMIYDNSMSQ